MRTAAAGGLARRPKRIMTILCTLVTDLARWLRWQWGRRVSLRGYASKASPAESALDTYRDGNF